ncbi:MAG: D-arabinono-1,4-lactone oxidase [Pseudomonadales bacterium]|nr:D-arabinono-1,4-lactone oxidase [Pseudomonadales bacterium]
MSGWRNWSGAISCPGSRIAAPQDEAGLAELVRTLAPGQVLRAVGSGHSFYPFWSDGDLLVDLAAFHGVRAVEGQRVRLGAGTPIHAIGPLLAPLGLALANQGDIDRQTLAGAVATGTHGTGRGLGSLSSMVRAMRLVDGTGRVRILEDADSLAAGRVSLGLLGVVTELTVEVVPSYGLHERNWQAPVETVLDEFDQRTASHRHHEFWWVPRNDLCIAKTLDPVALPTDARLDEVPFGESGERWGPSWAVFPSARETRFNEMEYAVPAAAGLDCFRALRAALLRDFPSLPWPIEYRIVAGDDGWLSPTAGVEVAALSVHQDARRDPAPLFACAEPILRAHGGRPHWGKCHGLDRSAAQQLYPRLGDFEQARGGFDPQDRFLGAALRRLLLD